MFLRKWGFCGSLNLYCFSCNISTTPSVFSLFHIYPRKNNSSRSCMRKWTVLPTSLRSKERVRAGASWLVVSTWIKCEPRLKMVGKEIWSFLPCPPRDMVEVLMMHSFSMNDWEIWSWLTIFPYVSSALLPPRWLRLQGTLKEHHETLQLALEAAAFLQQADVLLGVIHTKVLIQQKCIVMSPI